MTSIFDDDDVPATTGPSAADGSTHKKGSRVDRPRIEAAVREILLAIGEDPDRSGLQDTPKRVAKAYTEMFAGLHHDPAEILATTFDLDHEELVLVKDIPFYSTCEHHLVPFHGMAHVGYIPSHDGKITGLSKLARLVDMYARRLQLQERLTEQISKEVMESVDAKGVGVMIEARHLCMMMRGVEKQNSVMITSSVLGTFRESTATREEFLALIGSRPT